MTTTQWVAASGDWNTAANWSNGVPGPSDTAVFDTGSVPGPNRHTVSATGVSVGTLTLEDSTLFTGSLTGTTATIASGEVRLYGAGTVWTLSSGLTETTGSLFVIDGAQLVAGGSGLTVGSRQAALSLDPESTLTGTLTLSNGGFLNAENSSTGSTGSVALNGPILLSGAGGTITTGNVSYPGPANLGTGTLTLSGAVTGAGEMMVNEYADMDIMDGYLVFDESGGTVRLANGTNTYSGGTSVLSGTLLVAAPGAAGTGPISVAHNVATLVVAAGVGSLPAITGGGTVVNADAALQLFEPGSQVGFLGEEQPELTFLNGAGHSTVVGGETTRASAGVTLGPGQGTVYGGTGAVTVFGGNNLVYGGSSGNNLVVSDAGDTMVGGGSGDLLVGSSGHDVMIAGAGNETLTSAAEPGTIGTSAITGISATGALVFGGSGADVIACGSLYDTVVAGSGATSIYGGAADPSLLYAGSGADVVVTGGRGDFVQLGAGSATIFATQGANLITAVDGAAGGSALVVGFKPGLDALALRGYGGSGTMAGITSSQVAGGSTVLMLADNTRITLQGVTNLGTSSFA